MLNQWTHLDHSCNEKDTIGGRYFEGIENHKFTILTVK